VAARSKVWVLAAWILGSRIRTPLNAWMFVLVFLCRYRPCDGPTSRPRSPTNCRKKCSETSRRGGLGSPRTVKSQEGNKKTSNWCCIDVMWCNCCWLVWIMRRQTTTSEAVLHTKPKFFLIVYRQIQIILTLNFSFLPPFIHMYQNIVQVLS
jgi:hypothetical protein